VIQSSVEEAQGEASGSILWRELGRVEALKHGRLSLAAVHVPDFGDGALTQLLRLLVVTGCRTWMNLSQLMASFYHLEEVWLCVVIALMHVLDMACSSKGERATKIGALFLILLLNACLLLEELVSILSRFAKADN